MGIATRSEAEWGLQHQLLPTSIRCLQQENGVTVNMRYAAHILSKVFPSLC